MFEEINHQRRRFLSIVAMTIATIQLGRFRFNRQEEREEIEYSR